MFCRVGYPILLMGVSFCCSDSGLAEHEVDMAQRHAVL